MQDTIDDDVFQFPDDLPNYVFNGEVSGFASQSGGSADVLQSALVAAGAAAYEWEITTDTITWSANAADVLGCPADSVSSGRLFAALLDVANETSRYETVMNSNVMDIGGGVPFQIEYQFRSLGRKNAASVWLEDCGLWHAGADGSAKIVHGTVRRIDARHNRDKQLSYLANFDQLTAIMNRIRMVEFVDEAITTANKSGSECCFALARVNKLSAIKEAYGFEVADQVIVTVSQRLSQVMRQGDGIARFSTSQFAFMLKDCDETSLIQALSRFESVIRDNPIETSKGPVWTTISLGAVVLPHHASTTPQAIAHAEEVLTSNRARNGSAVYQPSKARDAEREFNTRCAEQLARCLRQNSFRLTYQPIVVAKTSSPLLYEARLRLGPEYDVTDLRAAQIIPQAQRLGLVSLLDRATTTLVMQALTANPDFRLSINISDTTANDSYWNEQLLEILEENSAATKRLTVGFEESTALADSQNVRRFMESLRSHGASVAVNHFGRSFGVTSRLRELPINMIKFDGSLSRNVEAHPVTDYVLKSMVELAVKFNLKTVATWVESEADADVLTQLGIDYLQGHHFGAASLEAPWRSKPELSLQIGEVIMVAPPVSTQEPSVSVDLDTTSPLIDKLPDDESNIPYLDFSEIDESINKLRAALSGLSAASQKSETQGEAVAAA